ncbi:alpha/beta fold hydrolase [Nocardioidaceae bacterium]|nr:alpha/beta fold hydrolase [Nocardioidaceae bacterium]
MTSSHPGSARSAWSSPGRPGADGRTVGVLLSHGFTGSPVSIRPWAEHLATAGLAVSVPLLPGHGTRWQDMIPTRYDDYREEVDRAFSDLRDRCDVVVVGGLSMGGCLTLELAARRADEVAGVVVVNPAVASTNKQLKALPVLKHVVRAFPGIGNDIKAGGDEGGYAKTPLRSLDSMVRAWPQVRALLPEVTCPVLLFRSVEDHVVDPSSARLILESVGSDDTREVLLRDSYHVATLDHDAPTIFEQSLDFVRRVTGSPLGTPLETPLETPTETPTGARAPSGARDES